MPNYVSKFLNSGIPGSKFFSSAQNTLSQNKGKLLECLKKWRDEETESICYLDNITSCLITDLSDLPQPGTVNIPQKGEYESDFVVDTDEETVQDVLNTIQENLDNAKKTGLGDGSGIVLTDTSGHAFSMQIVTDDQGRKVVSTCYDPKDYSDYFIFYDEDDKPKINTLIKTLDYWNGDLRNTTTVISSIQGINDFGDINATAPNIFEFLKIICAHYSLAEPQTIRDACQSLVNKFGTAYANISQSLNGVYLYLQSIYGRLREGCVKYIGDILSALTLKSTLADIYISATNLLLEEKFSLEAFNATVGQYASSTISAVKTVLSGIASAFATGGWYGVVSYLISVIKGQKSIQVENGVLVYTDDSSLAPKQYIAGTFCTIVSSIGSALSMALTVISPIIGIIGTLITSVIGAIPMAINYDYQRNTNAAAYTGDAYQVPVAPHAVLQLGFSNNQLLYELRKEISGLLDDSGSILTIPVPGGLILCGNGSKKEGSQDDFRFEFHPATDYPDNLPFLLDGLAVPFDSDNDHWHWIFPIENVTADKLEQIWLNFSSNWVPDNNNDGMISNEEDVRLRQNILRNFALFEVWLLLKYYHFTSDTSYSYIQFCDGAWNESLQNQGYEKLSEYFVISNLDSFNVSWNDIKNLVSQCLQQQEVKIFYHLQNDMSWSVLQDYSRMSCNLSVAFILNNKHWLDNITALPIEYAYQFEVPKYDKRTFLMWVLVATAIVAAVTVVAVVSALKIKKWRLRKRAKLTSQVSNNWESYTKAMKEYDETDPDDRPEYHTDQARQDAYKAYYKSVKKNNLLACITGGTKYSLAGYWDADASDSEVVDNPDREPITSTLLTAQYNDNNDSIVNTPDRSLADSINLTTIYNLIKQKKLETID